MGEQNQEPKSVGAADKCDSHPLPAAPPTSPGNLPSASARSLWPNVVGVLCIVIGGLGIFMGIFAIAMVFAVDVMAGMLNNDAEYNAMMKASKDWEPIIIAVNILKALVAAALLGAGILIVRRRAGARTWALRYSVLQILFAFISSIQGLMMQRQMMAAVLEQDSSSAPVGQNFANGLGMVGTGIGFIWLLILPIFLLIWFRRLRIREEISNW